MSWLDRIKDQLTITTGDGREYTPHYLNAKFQQAFNVAEFDFVNLPGTLVSRNQPKGRRYAAELFFQGENHLDDAEAFRVSANDPRAWTLSHPLYDDLTVQPISLDFDNSVQNITKVTGVLVETITEDGVKTVTSPVDEIETQFESVDTASADAFVAQVQPTASDTQKLSTNNTNAYTEGAKSVTGAAAQAYRNAFSAADSAIAEVVAAPSAAINALQQVLVAPSRFKQSAQARLNLLSDQFATLRSTLENTFTPNEKRIYQNNAGSMVNAAALAVSTPQDGDYTNAPQVLAVSDQLAAMYAQYLEDLDGLQTDNGAEEESYIPDPEPLTELNTLVNYTIANLTEIALESAQERSIICETDTNPILLTHRLYGLDNADENLQYMMDTNNMGLNEVLEVRKGRRVVYYV